MGEMAILMAAGLGTRFLPATKAQPKEMLPIVDKPTIQYIIEEAAAAGIEDIIIVTGRSKRSIEDHFDRSIELEMELEKDGKDEMLNMVKEISEIANIHFRCFPRDLPDWILLFEYYPPGTCLLNRGFRDMYHPLNILYYIA